MAGEEAPPEGFSGGAAGILAHGLPVGRALPAQRLEPHRICGQGVGQVLGRLLAARGRSRPAAGRTRPHAVSSTAIRTEAHRMAASGQLL
ncbi:hypothetical protein LTSEMON_5102 [Salmonella enterica subsp. enterica serovar Montevideo str. S5-403]|uniref:Uncharacterized protein n=1 Tax=Salmonella enterica subsp. enterica serovar Montevideo str. S5-403 TaxID=913242 RepID=G5Q9J1_SALMO|nr:hypothetical protein LTSEMON_5102 [Salmonella enterica subsp. enterica serovar Montevideo str. S5-403]